MKKILYSFILAGILFTLAFASAGCINGEEGKIPPNAQTGTEKSPVANKIERETRLYYPDANGEYTVAVFKKIAAKDETELYKKCVEALIGGTKEKGLIGIFPAGTTLRDISVKDKIATVDFSKDLVKNFSGGSTGEILLAATLANTLTEFPAIEKVKIVVEGKPIETLAGHLDLSEPLVREKKLIR